MIPMRPCVPEIVTKGCPHCHHPIEYKLPLLEEQLLEGANVQKTAVEDAKAISRETDPEEGDEVGVEDSEVDSVLDEIFEDDEDDEYDEFN